MASHDVHAAQVLLNSSDVSTRVNYLNARATLRRLLQWRCVPVINENDTTATDEITFGDNDFLAAQVALLLGARQLVLLTDTAGLHTADPRHNAGCARWSSAWRTSRCSTSIEIGDRTSLFGSGGMRSKVAAAEMATAAGIETWCATGRSRDSLARAAGGEKVRHACSRRGEGRAPSFKLWLRYAKPSARHGADRRRGGSRACASRGRACFPWAIVEVEGDFEAGDAIEVVAEGALVGKGIVNYSAGELGRIKGMKSAAVRELMPHAADEAVHRDSLRLLALNASAVPFEVPMATTRAHNSGRSQERESGFGGARTCLDRGEECCAWCGSLCCFGSGRLRCSRRMRRIWRMSARRG